MLLGEGVPSNEGAKVVHPKKALFYRYWLVQRESDCR